MESKPRWNIRLIFISNSNVWANSSPTNNNSEGYTYTKEEIEAYQVPYKIAKGPCVDTYIPLKKCSHANPVSFASKMLD